MISLTSEAQSRLDQYLREIRFALGGAKSVDAAEVERDVMEHIERELVDRPQPILLDDLLTALGALGSPSQWVPEDELPWWRRAILQLYRGPEDWRLAYLSLGLLLLGLISAGALLFVAVLGSFVCARAALAAAEERNESLEARKWLIYPSLIVGYLFLAVGLLLPAIGLGVLGDVLDEYEWVKGLEVLRGLQASEIELVVGGYLFVLGLSLTGTLVGAIVWRSPQLLRVVFRPFADHATRDWGARLTILSGGTLAVVLLASALAVALAD